MLIFSLVLYFCPQPYERFFLLASGKGSSSCCQVMSGLLRKGFEQFMAWFCLMR
jgi:hypothetical protein